MDQSVIMTMDRFRFECFLNWSKAYFHNLNTTKYSLIQISSHLGVRVEPVRIEVLFQIQSINEGFFFIYFLKFILQVKADLNFQPFSILNSIFSYSRFPIKIF